MAAPPVAGGRALRRWALPLVLWLLATAAGCLYFRWYLAYSLHVPSGWFLNGDLLRYVDAAGTIEQPKGLAHLYAFDKPDTPFVAPPGFLVGMGIVLRLLGAAGQHVSDYYLSVPTFRPVLTGAGWDYLLPVVTAAGLSGVFPADALARRLGASGARRLAVVAGITAGLWWTAVDYEHPDDALAIGLVMAAVALMLKGRVNGAAWCCGAGCAVQPLVLLAAVPLLGVLAVRRWPGFLLRTAAPAAALLVIPFAGDFTDTFDQVVTQPVDPHALISHPTPVLALSPHLVNGEPSGSPLRLLSFALAAVVVWRTLARAPRPVDAAVVAWLVAVALDLRIVAESVVYPYDLAPGLVLGLVAAAGRRTWRLGAAATVAVGTAAFSETRLFGEWGYWLCVLAGLAVMLAVARPTAAGGLGASGRLGHELAEAQEVG